MFLMRQPKSPETDRDQWHAEQFGISQRDIRAFQAHRSSAKTRGIPFDFTLLGWVIWWRSELRKIGPEAMRGRKRDQYVMARKGDQGGYEPGNVYCAKPIDNARDIPEDVRAMAAAKALGTCAKKGKPRGSHLKVRGDGHPKSKAVVTPLGRFGSIALAAEAHGITRQGGFYAVRRGAWTLAT